MQEGWCFRRLAAGAPGPQPDPELIGRFPKSLFIRGFTEKARWRGTRRRSSATSSSSGGRPGRACFTGDAGRAQAGEQAGRRKPIACSASHHLRQPAACTSTSPPSHAVCECWPARCSSSTAARHPWRRPRAGRSQAVVPSSTSPLRAPWSRWGIFLYLPRHGRPAPSPRHRRVFPAADDVLLLQTSTFNSRRASPPPPRSTGGRRELLGSPARQADASPRHPGGVFLHLPATPRGTVWDHTRGRLRIASGSLAKSGQREAGHWVD
jgi:hypothetical protein